VERLHRAADRLAAALALAGVLGLMSGVAVLMVDIAGRKSVGFSVLGTIDITQLAQMACVFLVLPLAFLREAHVSVDFVTSRFPPRLRAVIECASALLAVALLAAIVWYSWQQAAIQHRQADRSVTLGIPMIAFWAPLLAGTALSAAACLLLFLRNLALLKSPRR